MRRYRLDQDVVLPKQQGGSVVLVQGLNVVAGGWRGGGPLVHAAAGVPLLELAGGEQTVLLYTIHVKRAGSGSCLYAILMKVGVGKRRDHRGTLCKQLSKHISQKAPPQWGA